MYLSIYEQAIFIVSSLTAIVKMLMEHAHCIFVKLKQENI